MTAVLLDTHAWAWSLTGDRRLSAVALAAIHAADDVLVSPITFFEIAQKVRLGKWPEMTAFIGQLPSLLQSQGALVAPFGPATCLEAGIMEWVHRDPFDRLLAATARQGNYSIVPRTPSSTASSAGFGSLPTGCKGADLAPSRPQCIKCVAPCVIDEWDCYHGGGRHDGDAARQGPR